MKESTIQKWVQDLLVKEFEEDIYIFKVPQGQYTSRRGIPDLCMCIKGMYVAIEVKTDNGSPTRLQVHEIDKINRAGGLGTVIYGKDEAKLQAIIRMVRGE